VEVGEEFQSGENFLFDFRFSFRCQHLRNFFFGSLAVEISFKIEDSSLAKPPHVLLLRRYLLQVLLAVHIFVVLKGI